MGYEGAGYGDNGMTLVLTMEYLSLVSRSNAAARVTSPLRGSTWNGRSKTSCSPSFAGGLCPLSSIGCRLYRGTSPSGSTAWQWESVNSEMGSDTRTHWWTDRNTVYLWLWCKISCPHLQCDDCGVRYRVHAFSAMTVVSNNLSSPSVWWLWCPISCPQPLVRWLWCPISWPHLQCDDCGVWYRVITFNVITGVQYRVLTFSVMIVVSDIASSPSMWWRVQYRVLTFSVMTGVYSIASHLQCDDWSVLYNVLAFSVMTVVSDILSSPSVWWLLCLVSCPPALWW